MMKNLSMSWLMKIYLKKEMSPRFNLKDNKLFRFLYFFFLSCLLLCNDINYFLKLKCSSTTIRLVHPSFI